MVPQAPVGHTHRQTGGRHHNLGQVFFYVFSSNGTEESKLSGTNGVPPSYSNQNPPERVWNGMALIRLKSQERDECRAIDSLE